MTQLHKLSPVAATIGTIQQFPMLRGFWPTSGQSWDGSTLRYSDYSANGFHMLASGTVNSQSSLEEAYEHYVPHVHMNGFSNSYLYYPDNSQFDILGNESFVASAQRGLTWGLWWHSDIIPIAGMGLFGKYWTSASNRSFLLYLNAASPYPPVGLVSGTGITNLQVAPVAGTGDLTVDRWSLTVIRFDPSTSLKMFHNGHWSSNTTSIPATIFNGIARLEVGSYNNGASRFDGGVSMPFICASAVHEKMIENLWEISREMFGR